MNINPNAVRVLCYGDSNTWGHVPISKERYPTDVRWTGLLQKELGNTFEIVEEGLGSRTTQWEYSEKQGRNGRTYLLPCIESHNPIDIVILFLGTNDLKAVYNQTPQQIASSIRELIHIIREKAWDRQKSTPKILLVSPAIVDESVPSTQDKYRGAQIKSEGLAAEYESVANEENCSFVDLSGLVRPSRKDGLHFEPEAHQIISDAFVWKVRELASK